MLMQQFNVDAVRALPTAQAALAGVQIRSWSTLHARVVGQRSA